MKAPGRWMTVMAVLLCVAAGCRPDEAESDTPVFDARAVLMNPDHTAWSAPAPDVFRARFETSQGVFVIEGMEVVERLYAGYDEEAGGGMRGGKQGKMLESGNAHLDKNFPLLDKLRTATIVQEP